jgi:protein-tyrosine phosphatase
VPGLVDLHSHLLPGVDDGAETVTATLALLHQAIAQGASSVVLTPHLFPEDREEKAALHGRRFGELKQIVADLGLPVELHLGAEITFRAGLSQVVSWPGCTLAGSQYVLVDLAPGPLPLMLEQGLFELRAAGYRPILAHPERQRMLTRNPQQIARLRAQEVLLQVDASSLTGRFGRRSRHAATQLIRGGQVDFVASDAHDLQRRPFELDAAFDVVVQLAGRHVAEHLLTENPRRVVTHSPVIAPPHDYRDPRQSGLRGLIKRWRRLSGWSSDGNADRDRQ